MNAKQYYPIPRSILRWADKFGLTLDSIILYAFLCALACLSADNGWLDKAGKLYVSISRAKVQDQFHWSKEKTCAMFAQLVGAGLLAEHRYNYGTKRLYLRRWVEPWEHHPVEALRNGGFAPITPDNCRTLPENYISLDISIIERADINTTAKVLYAIIKDEAALAAIEGRDYCTLSAKDTIGLLCCSERTFYTAYAQLETAGLIERGEKDFASSRMVRLKDAKIIPQSSKNPTSSQQIPDLQSSKNPAYNNLPESTSWKYPSQDSLRARTPAPVYAPTCARVEAPFGEKKENLLDWAAIAADVAKLMADSALAEEVAAKVQAVYEQDCTSRVPYYCFGRTKVDRAALMTAYKKIDRYIVVTAILKIADNWGRIKNSAKYIRMTLFAAEKHEAEAYYTRLRLAA